jgi:multiple sugar transport system permease protein
MIREEELAATPGPGLAAAEARFGRRLVAPAVLIIGCLILYPILYNIILSFFDVKLRGANIFVGTANYREVLRDPGFWKAVWTTFIYVAATTLGTTLVGLGVALVMNQEFPLRGLVRGLILLPYVAPVIAVVFSWQFIFDPVNGPFMHLTYEILHLFKQRFNLIGSPQNAVIVAILFNIWKNFPFTYLMILSKLQAVDISYYEAADIDGATSWQKFRYITLPELYFVVGAIVILRFIWNFNKFEEVYLLTENVKVLSVYTYFKAFAGALDQGQGAAIALVQFLILIGFILFYVKRILKW